MKQVRIKLLKASVESDVKLQATSRDFTFLSLEDNIMVFEKDNNHIDSIYDLKRLPDLGPYIEIL